MEEEDKIDKTVRKVKYLNSMSLWKIYTYRNMYTIALNLKLRRKIHFPKTNFTVMKVYFMMQLLGRYYSFNLFGVLHRFRKTIIKKVFMVKKYKILILIQMQLLGNNIVTQF